MQDISIPAVLSEANWRGFAARLRQEAQQQLVLLDRNLIWFSLYHYLQAHPETRLRIFLAPPSDDQYVGICVQDESGADAPCMDLQNLNIFFNMFCYDSPMPEASLSLFVKALMEEDVVFTLGNIRRHRWRFFEASQRRLLLEEHLRDNLASSTPVSGSREKV